MNIITPTVTTVNTEGCHFQRFILQSEQRIEDLPFVLPLPEPPKLLLRFDREKLILHIGDSEFRLASLTSRGADFEIPRHPGIGLSEIREEIGDAGWEVFANRRFCRALALNESPEYFDFWELLDAGAIFDWEAGTYTMPGTATAPNAVTPLFNIDTNDETPSAELIEDRYLCKGGAMVLAGPTGIGKSSLGMQFAVGWSLGMDVLGLKPTRPLSILIIQAENDAGDLIEQRDGVIEGYNFQTEDHLLLVNDFVAVATVDDVTGYNFGVPLLKDIRQWQPDIVILDPLLAFVGGDISKQDTASNFLRGVLTPILHRANVAVLILHHTGKPPREGQDERHADYLGLGSSELANWPRAIMSLSRTKDDKVFRLEAGKRGDRLGWTDSDGKPCRVKFIRHAAHGIFWEPASETQAASSRPGKTPDDLMPHVPLEGSVPKTVFEEAANRAGIGQKRVRAFLDELVEKKVLYLWEVKRPGTNREKRISRHPQPQPTLSI